MMPLHLISHRNRYRLARQLARSAGGTAVSLVGLLCAALLALVWVWLRILCRMLALVSEPMYPLPPERAPRCLSCGPFCAASEMQYAACRDVAQ